MLARVRTTFGGFFGWWFGELAALLPGAMRRSGRRSLVFDLGGQEVSVHRCEPKGSHELGRVAAAGDAALEQRALSKLVQRFDLRREAVVLRIEPGRVLRKLIELPRAAEENLREVIGFAMDRQTPFKAAEVYFDYRLTERPKDAETLQVELAAVPRPVVDAALERARAWGLRPFAVDIREGEPPVAPRYNFLPKEERPPPPWRSGPLTWLLTISVVALLVVAVAIPLVRQAEQRDRLAQQVDEARDAFEAARRLRGEIERLRQESRFIFDWKRENVPSIVVLNELTRVLPDDTWIFQLRQRGAEVQIYGHSAAASGLIERIEQSGLFSNAAFRAPVTRDQQTDSERFFLAFTVGPGEASP